MRRACPARRPGGAGAASAVATALAGALLLVLGQSSAMAAPWDLRVRELPALPPTSLRMRVAPVPATAVAVTSAAASASAAGDGAGVDPGPALERARRQRRLHDQQPLEPSVSDQVTFRFNIGFGLDGGQLIEGQPNLAENTCDDACRQRYEELRIYGFGDAAIGTRGVLAQDLSTYFAARFRFEQDPREFSAVPAVHDGEGVDDVQVRSVYGDIHDVFESRWLRPLYLRIGRQYRYGPTVAHFDGVSVGYDTRAVSIGGFVGAGAQLYQGTGGLDLSERGMVGLNLRLDLAAMERAPLVITANYLSFAGHEHSDLAMAVQWSRDVAARLGVRSRDDAVARVHARLRARLSSVSIAVFELVHRTRDDWLYDLFPGDGGDPGEARAYLNLEPPGPRTHLSARAGTVLMDNVDLLLRGTAAVEHGEPGPDADPSTPDPTFASSYIEGSAALELRLQRTLSLGLSGLVRAYSLRAAVEMDEDASLLDRLEDRGHARERGFVEGGTTVRYSLGARRFSAEAEVYARFYGREPLLEMNELPGEDDRVGGRISVESWAAERLRLRAEYDVTTSLDVVPELIGFKSLRVLMEGRY